MRASDFPKRSVPPRRQIHPPSTHRPSLRCPPSNPTLFSTWTTNTSEKCFHPNVRILSPRPIRAHAHSLYSPPRTNALPPHAAPLGRPPTNPRPLHLARNGRRKKHASKRLRPLTLALNIFLPLTPQDAPE
ncbi:hypothetical protein OG21DRAFT_915905 [Imleria badia]|nr:hypothetical protein OG21DRAFT_915905 [Imleria badia]